MAAKSPIAYLLVAALMAFVLQQATATLPRDPSPPTPTLLFQPQTFTRLMEHTRTENLARGQLQVDSSSISVNNDKQPKTDTKLIEH